MLYCRRRLSAIFAVACLLQAECTSDETVSSRAGPPFEFGPAIVVAELSADLIEGRLTGTTAEFINPADIVLFEGGLALLESGTSRVLLLDPAGHVKSTFGREGAGPGEMRLPLAMTVSGGSLFVNDLELQRMIVLSDDGTQATQYPSPYGLFAAAGPDGAVYVVMDSLTHYAARLDRDVPILVAPRLTRAYRAGERPAADRIAVDSRNRFHVFDSRLGCLVRFASPSALKPDLVRCLPDGAIADSLRAYTMWDAVGSVPAPPTSGRNPASTKRLTVTSDGDLFLIFNAAPYFGLLIDSDTYQARPLKGTDDSDSAAWQKIRAAVIRQDTMYAIVDQFLLIQPLAR